LFFLVRLAGDQFGASATGEGKSAGAYVEADGRVERVLLFDGKANLFGETCPVTIELMAIPTKFGGERSAGDRQWHPK